MQSRAGALEAAHHAEVALVAAQVGEEDDAGLVAGGRRLEQAVGEGHGGGEALLEAGAVAGVERLERRRGRGGDCVEDAEQRIAGALAVAPDELGVVQIVARVEAHARRQSAAERPLAVRVQERRLDAVDPLGVGGDQLQHGFRGLVEVAGAPVRGEVGVELLAQPVQDHGAPCLAEYRVVDRAVVVRAPRRGGQGAARHDHGPAALALDEAQLLDVRVADRVEGGRPAGRKLVGAGPAGDLPSGRARLGDRSADELAGGVPVEAHSALGGVHRLGHAEAPRP
jgi:hypothetical protein